jgi:hypothetical protein
MASFKKLSTPDVFVVPYTANKDWSLNLSCVPQDGAYFTIYKGKNITSRFDILDGPVTENQYEHLVYRQINHLYYQSTSASNLDSHSLLSSIYYNQAPTESGKIATSSYFIFNENPSFINSFPTSSNDIIRVMSFNQNIYGEQIKPNNFILSTSGSFQLADDGLGNVYDISFTGYYVEPGYYAPPGYIVELSNKVFVGNIFYSQGLVVITNPNYVCFLPTPPNAINDYFKVLNVQRTKKLNILANDYIDSCGSTSINTGSIVTYPYTGYSFPSSSVITGSLFITECETLGVTPGNYKLRYTVNDNTCLTSNLATVNLELYKLPLEMSKTFQPIVCVGGVSTVVYSINYGIPPYQYSTNGSSWSNLPNCAWYQPTGSLTVPIGNSILYIKDSEGTIVSQSFTVVADIFTVTTSSTNVTCFGSGNGKIAVTGSSTYGAPYSASVDGGSTWNGFTTNTSFTSLTPATYTVTVKDNICSTSSLVTITQPAKLTVTIDSTTADCPEPGQEVGTINITITGGTSPYTYSWVTGSTQVKTVEDPTGLPAGTYKVTVTDANSCTATGSAVISSTALISIVLSPTNETCGNGSGSIAASVTGGSGTGFTYAWNTSPAKTTKDISGLATGTYQLTVTDTGTGCTSSGSATVSSSPGISAVSASITYNECDSSLVVTATGGTSPYTFVAVSGSTTKSVGPTATNPSTINLESGLAGGTWNVTVADANGCTGTTSKTIRAREYRYSDPVCQNLNATLIVDESMGVGTNLFINGVNGSAVQMVSTGYRYIQLHSGSLYGIQSPLYPPSDVGWIGNYPYASNTMSVFINNTSSYNSSSIDTGSANWLTYSLTADSTKDYFIITKASAASACDLAISSTTTTNPSNFGGTNGSATITFTTTHGPSTYRLNGGSPISASSPLVISGLSSATAYTASITDSSNCVATSSFTLGQTTFVFDADYMVLTYEFTDGRDLDTRTRIVSPNIGQTFTGSYLGWGQQSVWPASGTPILTWGGDNTGTGFESVLVNLIAYQAAYPSNSQLVADLRGQWYGTVGSLPVNVAAKLYKGGTMVPSGYNFANPTATASASIASVGKVISTFSTTALDSGTRIATLTYDIVTNIGSFNSNDTSTPTV